MVSIYAQLRLRGNYIFGSSAQDGSGSDAGNHLPFFEFDSIRSFVIIFFCLQDDLSLWFALFLLSEWVADVTPLCVGVEVIGSNVATRSCPSMCAFTDNLKQRMVASSSSLFVEAAIASISLRLSVSRDTT